jgi:hypothetical protein
MEFEFEEELLTAQEKRERARAAFLASTSGKFVKSSNQAAPLQIDNSFKVREGEGK